LHATIAELDGLFAEFRLSEALMTTYRLVWDDFCSWTLELVKPPFGEPIDRTTLDGTVALFEELLKLLHPFMPFLTEELWHWIAERKEAKEAIVVAAWPAGGEVDTPLLTDFEVFKQIVSEVRTIRKDNQIPNKERLHLHHMAADGYPAYLEPGIAHLCNLASITAVEEKVPNSFGFLVDTHAFYLPFGDNVDVEAEKAKLTKELDYVRGFLKSVQGKLSNARFVSNAPEQVVDLERKKLADAEAKIAAIEAKLAELG
jgi:valyl-tRNA synthetase